MSNTLSTATSPYLLQHADQPVHWKQWGEEAMLLAKQRNCPVFLSIGYSTCHWCHVMAHESFDDPAVGAMVNERFVNIKVDREELPDVDAAFMSYVQAVTGRGGWPMSIWLTPDGDPIFGGTYFPPKQIQGRASFVDVCDEVHRVWQMHEGAVREKGADLLEKLQKQAEQGQAQQKKESRVSAAEALCKFIDDCEQTFDKEEAGFGMAPKFPRPALLRALCFAQGCREVDGERRQKSQMMFLATLDAMAAGGMNDQLGGGFHRYAVDAYWHVPHFEKMLYDQAQLARVFLDAWLITKKGSYREIAKQTMAYVLDELSDASGGFYCGDDADSLNEQTGHQQEGAFWLWSAEDIFDLLDVMSAQLICAKYGIQQGGNIRPESDPQDEFGEGNVLYDAMSTKDLAALFSLSETDCIEKLSLAKVVLLKARQRRPKPHRDDKVLTAWNAMVVSSLAYGARILKCDDWRLSAEKCISFIKGNLWDGKNLYRSWRKGCADVAAFPADYAQMISALLDMYDLTADEEHLTWAQQLQEIMTDLFWNSEQGGYLLTAYWGEKKLLSMREDYDGAEPSTQSIACMNLLRLTMHRPSGEYQKYIDPILAGSAETLRGNPFAVPLMLIAQRGAETSLTKIDMDRVGAHWELIGDRHTENIVFGKESASPSVCTGMSCLAPFANAEEWREWLDNYRY